MRERAFWVRGAVALGSASLALAAVPSALLPREPAVRLRVEPRGGRKQLAAMLRTGCRRRRATGSGTGSARRSDGPHSSSRACSRCCSRSPPSCVRGADGTAHRRHRGGAVMTWRSTRLDDRRRRAKRWTALLDSDRRSRARGAGARRRRVRGHRRLGGTLFGVVTSDRALLSCSAARARRAALRRVPRWSCAPTGESESDRDASLERRLGRLRLGLAVGDRSGSSTSLGTNFFFYRSSTTTCCSSAASHPGARGDVRLRRPRRARRTRRARASRSWSRASAARRDAAAVCALAVCAAAVRVARGAARASCAARSYPDAVTLRLKETPMRGGLVELPAGSDGNNHRYMLRAADHGTPARQRHVELHPASVRRIVRALTRAGPITFAACSTCSKRFRPPTSSSTTTLHRARAPHRLRAVPRARRRLGAPALRQPLRRPRRPLRRDKTEPERAGAKASAASTRARDRLDECSTKTPSTSSASFAEWGRTLYRLHASRGRVPRYAEFMPDASRSPTASSRATKRRRATRRQLPSAPLGLDAPRGLQDGLRPPERRAVC